MEERIVKLYTKNSSIPLKVVPGHFATNHSHVNYYLDMTTLKTVSYTHLDVYKRQARLHALRAATRRFCKVYY